MRRALQLAANGRFYTSPNPMVGAVIVANDKIIGEGYHRRCGEGHAEVNAIASVKDKSLLQQSTMYATLEPCSHFGKTPPCAQLIIDSKIPHVIVGSLDPFEKVSGRGIGMLQDAGIKVLSGILEEECKQLNLRFITAHTNKRPMITLKWAQSSDGYMDIVRDIDERPALFSTSITSILVHKLRAEHDAIMVGTGTIIADNPHLNVRYWGKCRNPRIIIVERETQIPASANVLKADMPPIYIAEKCRDELKDKTFWINTSKQTDLHELLKTLYKNGITSLLVEGGATLLKSFIENNLWDIIRIEKSPIVLGESGKHLAPAINITPANSQIIDGNEILYLNACGSTTHRRNPIL